MKLLYSLERKEEAGAFTKASALLSQGLNSTLLQIAHSIFSLPFLSNDFMDPKVKNKHSPSTYCCPSLGLSADLLPLCSSGFESPSERASCPRSPFCWNSSLPSLMAVTSSPSHCSSSPVTATESQCNEGLL